MNPRKFARRRFLQVAGSRRSDPQFQEDLATDSFQAPRSLLFYLGTYTAGRSEGIYLCRLDLDTGAIALGGCMQRSFESIVSRHRRRTPFPLCGQ